MQRKPVTEIGSGERNWRQDNLDEKDASRFHPICLHGLAFSPHSYIILVFIKTLKIPTFYDSQTRALEAVWRGSGVCF